MMFMRSLFRFHTRSPNLLREFGITNQNIYRNLRYPPTQTALANSMKWESLPPLPTPAPKRVSLLIMGLSWPFQEVELAGHPSPSQWCEILSPRKISHGAKSTAQ